MGDHQDRLTAAVDAREQAQQLVGGLGVQRAGGLVRQQQPGPGDQCPGDGRALLLTAGDLVGVLLQKVGDGQLVGDGPQPPLHLVVGEARQHQRQIDVVFHGEGVQQIELLEHEAQLVPAECGNLALPDLVQILAVQADAAGGGPVQRREDVEQRGLARAGFAHDGHVFALLHAEVHVAQGLHLVSAQAGGVNLLQFLDFQYRHVCLTSC